jgi:hypothetical protein
MADYARMDEALERLRPYGPDLLNGFTNHAPMAVEALSALGRADAVLPWVERYRQSLAPRPARRERIPPDGWRAALGRTDRTADWHDFFVERLREAPWRDVLARWTAELAPAVSASATHGVIRVAHAVRSLGQAETPARLDELAEGLGYWAACHRTLPTSAGSGPRSRAADAIQRVSVVPPAARRFEGSIDSSLDGLVERPEFGPVIDLLDVDAPLGETLSDLSETFARVYLGNARDVLTTIVFVHAVTSIAAVRSLAPYLAPGPGRDAVRYAWQAGCALYATFASGPPAKAGAIEPPREDAATLVDLAIANGDEHAIKLTEACLREHALRPSPAYLAAASHATRMLGTS